VLLELRAVVRIEDDECPPVDTGARLADDVLPHVPVRQWVLSLPFEIRHRLAYNGERIADVLAVFLPAVSAWYRRQVRALGSSGSPVVDLYGRAIGGATFKREAENLNFAIPGKSLLALLDKTQEGEALSRLDGPFSDLLMIKAGAEEMLTLDADSLDLVRRLGLPCDSAWRSGFDGEQAGVPEVESQPNFPPVQRSKAAVVRPSDQLIVYAAAAVGVALEYGLARPAPIRQRVALLVENLYLHLTFAVCRY